MDLPDGAVPPFTALPFAELSRKHLSSFKTNFIIFSPLCKGKNEGFLKFLLN